MHSNRSYISSMLAAVCTVLFGMEGSGMTLGKIGSTNLMYHGLTAKDYILDGLTAMWDGVENAGFGHRQTGSIVWKDLVGSHDLSTTVPNQYYWTDNSLHFDGLNTSLDHRGMECSTISMAYFEIVAVKRGVNTSVFAQNGGRSANNLLLWQYYNFGSCLAHNGAAQRFPSGTIKKDVPLTMGVTVGTSTPELFVNGAKITPSSSADGWSVYNVFSLFANSLSKNGGYNNGAEKEIYNARCYSRFLTAAEIAANHAVDKARFNLP